MKWFNDLGVRSKLLVVFGIILLLSVVTSVVNFFEFKQLKDDMHILIEDNYAKIDKFDEWKVEVLMIAELLRNMLLVEDQKRWMHP